MFKIHLLLSAILYFEKFVYLHIYNINNQLITTNHVFMEESHYSLLWYCYLSGFMAWPHVRVLLEFKESIYLFIFFYFMNEKSNGIINFINTVENVACTHTK
jgi:hypothetical protein